MTLDTVPSTKIRRAEVSDLPRLLEFYRKLYPERLRLTNPEFQSWLLLKRPAKDEKIPLFILEADERIVGSIGYVSSRLLSPGFFADLIFPVNYFVDPRYRGLPALRLLRSVMGEHQSLVGTLVSGNAHRLMVKMGFADRSSELLGYHYGLLPSGSARSHIFAATKRIIEIFRGFALRACSPGVRYRISADLDETLAAHFNHMPGVVHTDKSVDRLRWRYADCPALECLFLYQLVDGAPTGLAILHVDKSRRELVLLDLLWNRQDRLLLLGLTDAVIAFARKAGCARVVTHALSPWLGKALNLCLFRSERSQLGLLAHSTNEVASAILTSSQDLHLMLGDTDAY